MIVLPLFPSTSRVLPIVRLPAPCLGVRILIVETVDPDHDLLRQISSLVATLPTIDAQEFRKELETVDPSFDTEIQANGTGI